MKRSFSTRWKSSAQPRKQHKYRHNAPLHIKHRFLNAHLSKELRKKYGKRSLPLRKGDEVLVMQGSFKRKKAKVVSVNLRRSRVALEGLQHTRRDGTKVPVTFHPRILQIQALVTDDKERLAVLQRTAAKQTSSSQQ